MNKKNIFLLLMSLFFCTTIFSQKTANLYGTITDKNGNPIELVNIAILNSTYGSSSDIKGNYQLKIPAQQQLTLKVTHLSFEERKIEINLKPDENWEINIILIKKTDALPQIIIEAKTTRPSNISKIDPKMVEFMPGPSSGIEALIKSEAGVSSSSELSSQYSVRGGNYDENLIYVNDIEIFRPLLVRSGEQEGLSFLNSELVSSILFSAGGFDAKYGDKMSSVLDIRYKKPKNFGGSFTGSLLGASLHLEGANKRKNLSFLLGVRQKSNQYLLNSLQTEGEYKPSFTDLQAMIYYDINKKWEVSFLGNYARNVYKLVPESRETDFGTFNEQLRLFIFFDGQETDRFDNSMGALTLLYKPLNNVYLKMITTAYQAQETENFDILGQYWIGRLDSSLGPNSGEVVQALGAGSFFDHARNEIFSRIVNIEQRGKIETLKNFFQWGVKFQKEWIEDKLSEWELIDSAGYFIPNPPQQVGEDSITHYPLELFKSVNLEQNISSNRISGFFQNTFDLNTDSTDISLTTGVRFQHWSLNEEFLVSPRFTFSVKPNWKKDIVLKFSAGYYYQPAFYRELRDLYGNLNTNISSQRSIHFVLGSDYNFNISDRPFKLTSSAYYKSLTNLIPYDYDNVRIKYYANNDSKGYAYGFDVKMNGEFVPGAESWVSISLLKTYEDIVDDFYRKYDDEGESFTNEEIGYRRRPSDRRFNFAIYLQDYLPKNPTYKVHLSAIYGSRLPFSIPDTKNYKTDAEIPAYRRVDIGFSKLIKTEDDKWGKKKHLRNVKSIWISAEVFNLLGINNTISYLWLKDFSNRSFAIPNHLTPRQINIKLHIEF